MQVNTIPIILENTRMVSPKVKHFVFKTPQDIAFNYLPGQFITIHFEREGKTLRRSYSIANMPALDNRIEFAAGFVENGPGTEFLFHLNPGDCIHINGPFGRLVLKDEMPSRYILAATSTGITPYRAMIPELKRRIDMNPLLNVVILLGVQTREDILYADEFLALAAHSPRITFSAHLSRESRCHLHNPHEHMGYVQHAFPALALSPDNDHVYLCGNPAMIDDAFNYLKDQGFAMQNVIREKYISGTVSKKI
ncbi:MAG TPA: ferredoxin--NADP(+) reductase [Legionella sp.]|nr:ferredoxin--NADP(+) reductase [Legionella sp.]